MQVVGVVDILHISQTLIIGTALVGVTRSLRQSGGLRCGFAFVLDF